jgi:hypothetical protein
VSDRAQDDWKLPQGGPVKAKDVIELAQTFDPEDDLVVVGCCGNCLQEPDLSKLNIISKAMSTPAPPPPGSTLEEIERDAGL